MATRIQSVPKGGLEYLILQQASDWKLLLEESGEDIMFSEQKELATQYVTLLREYLPI